MSELFDNPLALVALCVLTAVVLGAIWLQTGTKAFLHGMLAALMACVMLLVLDRVIETDRERVSATLHAIARSVERNDVDRTVQHVHSSVPELRQQAAAEMARWTFEQVDIKPNLQIVVFPHEEPPRAVAEFNVMVILSDRAGMISERRIPRFFRVTLLQEEGHWRVANYEHYDPQEGYRRR